MGYIVMMQTVAETPTFTRQAELLFGHEEKQELIKAEVGVSYITSWMTR
jgi:hypothetical protein